MRRRLIQWLEQEPSNFQVFILLVKLAPSSFILCAFIHSFMKSSLSSYYMASITLLGGERADNVLIGELLSGCRTVPFSELGPEDSLPLCLSQRALQGLVNLRGCESVQPIEKATGEFSSLGDCRESILYRVKRELGDFLSHLDINDIVMTANDKRSTSLLKNIWMSDEITRIRS